MSDIDEFEHQLKQEELERSKAEQGASRTKVDPDGTEYEWDDDKKAWFPKIDANFIAQYQMNYGSHAAVDEEATKAVKRAAEISATIKRGAKGKEDGSSEASENADENKAEAASEDWRYYYDLASRYAAREGEEQSAEDKQYYDYYTYYYQYYYTLEQNKTVGNDGESQMDEDQQAAYQKYCKESEEYYDTYYAQQSAEPKQSGERKKKGKHGDDDDMDYESKDYWEQYHDENFVPKNVEEVAEKNEPSKDGKNSKRKKKKDPVVPEKRKAEEGWFKIEEEKNTNVYVSGLPDDITDDEFKDLMNKCGLIVYDPKIRGLKVKLYKDADKKPKGDGICCYIKSESVDLALQLLDESELRGHKIHVEKAKFEMKGNYDPNKRKYKKLSNKEKRKAKENQAKLLDWRPDKPAGTKGKADKVVIIKNLFDNKTFETQPELINTIRQSLRQQCANYGDVTKVTIHDHHKDGVATVMFKQPEEADACVTAMGGGLVAGRHVTAEIWDGKTKYEVQETEEQREERLKKWDQYLAEGGEKPAEAGEKPAEAGEKPAEAGEKPAEAGEKPAEAGEKPAEAGEKPDEAGEKPDGENPVVTGEKVADAGANAGQTRMNKTSVMTLDNVKEDVPQDRQDAGEIHDTKSDEERSTQGNGEAEAMETSTATVSSTTTEQVSDSGVESRDSCDSVDDSRNTVVDSTSENTGSSER